MIWRFRFLASVIMLILACLWSPVGAQDGDLLLEAEQRLIALYERVVPSVVSIRIDTLVGSNFQEISGGSGFVYDESGHIITNYHVVDRADRIIVSFHDGTIVLGEVVGLDPFSDLAVVKVDLPGRSFVPLDLADSDEVRVGQSTVAIGSPFGQNWTLTTGVVSALGRQITSLSSFDIGWVIQTDTAINPGNSGGPLLNLAGQVIGVNTQIISELRASSGVGFAVPSNLVQRVARELIEVGEVAYGYLGIDVLALDFDMMQQLGLANNTRGIIVTSVFPGRPAALAGIQAPVNSSQVGRSGYTRADIIQAINDQPIYGVADLLGYIATNTRPGDLVQIRILRDGEALTLDVVLGAR